MKGRVSKELKAILTGPYGFTVSDVTRLEDVLRDGLTQQAHGMHFVDPNRAALVVDLTMPWYQCGECTFVSPITLGGWCVNCGSRSTGTLDPNTSEYIRARKGF